MKDKLVSVIIPTYNREKKISDAINSVLSQTYQEFEIIIVDDYSNDNTKDIISKKYKEESRIKYVLNKGIKGVSGARNYGIKCSKGEYISFLDSDDEWLPNHLADSINMMEERGIYVCFALWMERKADGSIIKVFDSGETKERLQNTIKNLKPEVYNNAYCFDYSYFEYATINKAYCTHINTMVINRRVLEKCEGFKESLKLNEDLDFILRVIYNFGFCLIMNYHFIYNTSDDSIYHFMDRSKIDIKTIIYKKEYVDKIADSCIYKIEHFIDRKEIIKNSSKISDKKSCIKKCNEMIGKKCLSIGILEQKLNKKESLKYFLRAICYYNKITALLCIIKLLNPFYKKVIEADLSKLSFV